MLQQSPHRFACLILGFCWASGLLVGLQPGTNRLVPTSVAGAEEGDQAAGNGVPEGANGAADLDGDAELEGTVDLEGTAETESRAAILEMAREGYERIQNEIEDYSCLLIKRERVQGRLGDYHYMFAKVRHARDAAGPQSAVPFSVYLRFLGPQELKGREVLYVDGENDGLLIARKGGLRFASVTTELAPTSELAMRDNRYPLTEFGIENLVRRFVEVVEEGVLLEDCTIQLMEGAKVDGRPCMCIEVKQRGTMDQRATFYLARVYIDDEWRVPIHYEAFGWPESEDGDPQLLEQYTYRDLKLNIGLDDDDFSRANPAYGFR